MELFCLPTPMEKNRLKSDALKKFRLFAPFSAEQLDKICISVPALLLRQKSVIFWQGERPPAMYLILEGGFKFEKVNVEGEIIGAGYLSEGQGFGEEAVLGGEVSDFTFMAVEDSVVLAVDRAALLEMLRTSTPGQALDMFSALHEQARAVWKREFEDTLSRRTLAAQMEAEKQRALTQMVAGVAHEINTPLNVINTAINIIARDVASPAEMTLQRAAGLGEALELAHLNVDRAQQLMQSFKKISVSQLQDERELFDIAEAIEETIGLVFVSLKRSRIHVKFHNRLAPERRKWMGYRGFLSQVVINLLTNAERYAYPKGAGGVIDVTIGLEGDSHYCLSVKDRGRGIPLKNQKRIFEPFFTTGKSNGGTGLGLSIVHNLVVNAFKGEVRLNSEEEKGAEFLVVFPREISD